MKHLLFYDGTCGLCDHAVQFLLWADKRELFVFAPLQGTTARNVLKDLPSEYKQADSLILVENYRHPSQKFYILGKGALRIFWLLGGLWTLLGVISFLPTFLYNWAYRIIARNRHHFFSQEQCVIPNRKNRHRFLS